MKKPSIPFLYRFSLVLAAMLLCVCPASAQAEPFLTVRVGYFDYGGFIEEDRPGHYTGYGVEYLMEISSYTGWNYEFVYSNWEDLLVDLEQGEIDLLCTAQYTPQRAQVFDYAEYESGVEYGALFVSQDNDRVFYGDTASFNGLRIGFLKDSYQNGVFEQYAREHHFTYDAAYYPSSQQTADALAAGEVDAVVTGSLRKTENERVVAKFSPDPFYFITTKGNTAVMDGINAAMEEIRTADVNFNAKLYDKYYGESVSSQLAFTRQEADYIKGHPSLKVACATQWIPVEYWEGSEGPYGISVDLMRLIADKSGQTLQFLRADSLDHAMQLAANGEADLVLGCPRNSMPAGAQSGFYLSKPYFAVPLTLAARQGGTHSSIKTVLLAHDLYGADAVNAGLHRDMDFIESPALENSLKAVRDGKADALLENTYLLKQTLADPAYRSLEPIYTQQITHPICIAVPKSQGFTLVSMLNKVITQINAEETQKIVLANTIQSAPVRFSAFLSQYGLPSLLLVLLVVLVTVLLTTLRSNKAMERLAYIDPVTQRRNLNKFFLDADKLLRGRKKTEYTLASLDLDKFKLVNDMYGYEMGNHVLFTIAKAISGCIQPDELFCRSNGDHFVILLHTPSDQQAKQRMDEIIERICAAPQALKKSFQLTVNCGLYRMEEMEPSINKAVDRADLARQSVKNTHKNVMGFYDSSMREKILREKEIENIMRPSLTRGEFIVYYQPKFSLTDQAVIGAEALVRWVRPDGRIIPPDSFIPIFESNGFVVQVDLYVFKEVCRQLRLWIDKGYYPYPISVNLSRVHLYQPDFYLEYLKIMEEFRVPAYLIELELTENAIFDNQIQLISIMRDLKKAGLSISMDDFGSGYSSLNLLKDMPIDFLKLDREFFNVSADTDRGKKIIRCIVAMARQLNICVVSEGVETREQVDFLREINCDVAQGYYFSKPIPLRDFEALAFAQYREKAAPAAAK